MTEQERREFERRKLQAERQLNQMYYGNSNNGRSNGGLKMPPFLSSAQKSEQTRASNEKKEQKASASAPAPQPKPRTSSQGRATNGMNLLNLLNFKGMQMDHDRGIILALCMLLSGEEADELLLLALLYIML